MTCGPVDQLIIFVLVFGVGGILLAAISPAAIDTHSSPKIAERNTRQNIRVLIYMCAAWAAVSLIAAISSGIWGTCQ